MRILSSPACCPWLWQGDVTCRRVGGEVPREQEHPYPVTGLVGTGEQGQRQLHDDLGGGCSLLPKASIDPSGLPLVPIPRALTLPALHPAH